MMTEQANNIAPMPDINAKHDIVGQTSIEYMYSSDKHYRVLISRDRKGLFRVHRERWDTSEWEAHKVAFWNQDDTMATITDSIDNARILARGSLNERISQKT